MENGEHTRPTAGEPIRGAGLNGRLDSWKEIASYLNRSERTIRRWEEREGLPVYRQHHEKRGSVYAYPDEVRKWWESRQLHDATDTDSPNQVRDPTSKLAGNQRASVSDPVFRPQALCAIPQDGDESRTGEPSTGSAVPPRWHAALLTGVLLVVAGVVAVMFGRSFQEPILRGSSPVRIRSLAVLPFENLSGDVEQEYFADGMIAELITELARISSIRVISRTSIARYKRVRKPLAEIAKELNVDGVVEGEVVHSGNQVRVTAQLIEVATDRHIWAETYDRDLHDVVVLQAEVAQSIAKAIGTRVMPAELRSSNSNRRMDPEAYENYLKGRFFFEKRTSESMKRAVIYFNQALRKDPEFALPTEDGAIGNLPSAAGRWRQSQATDLSAAP